MKFPPALQPGAPIFVVAPSGPFDSVQLKQGLERLSIFNVSAPAGMWGRQDGFLAGDDQSRRLELQHALDRPGPGAILVARGGYGLARIIDELDWTYFERNPKWLIGFSDATALHIQLWKRGYASIHGPNGTTLAHASEVDHQRLLDELQGVSLSALDLRTVVQGVARGPLVGGNLTLLFSEAAAGRLSLPPNAVLFVEDVTETSYRVDRMLHSLHAGGYFRGCSGLIFGDFTDCSPGKFQVSTTNILHTFAQRLGIPCAEGLPVGHGAHNRSLRLGATCQLEASAFGGARLLLQGAPSA